MMTTKPADTPCALGQVFTSDALTAGSGQRSSAGLLELPARFQGPGGTGAGQMVLQPRFLGLGNKGSWKPCVTMNCDIPVAELTRELWEYSTQGRWVDQEAGRWEATQRSEDSRSCLAHSVWLLDCG